jgi:predicted SAM-dependent methyltransferase
MQRNLNITIDQLNQSNSNIFINNIPSIVNYSCDSIFIDCLEYIPEKDLSSVVKILLDKIRPSGKLIISINNVDNIVNQFYKRSISHNEFLKFFTNKQNLLSVENIYTLIDFQTFDLLDIKYEDNFITILIERKNK